MRVTRGDNWAFFLLSGLTMLGIVGTFIAGQIFEFTRSEKEVIVYFKDGENKLSIQCDNQQMEINKVKVDVWKLFTKDCYGIVSIRLNDQYFGSCAKSINDYDRIEIIMDKEFSEGSCTYFN